MPVYYELHRHLGGAIVPRVFWRYLHRKGHILSTRFPRYEMLERYMTRPRSSLVDYLQLHRMVEGVQRLEALPYFVSKLVRGAYVFENIEYLELRYTPYLRTSESSAKENRLQKMEEVVDIIAEAARLPDYPVRMPQILCLHSRLPYDVNRRMVELAAARKDVICGIDLAGPDAEYEPRLDEWVELFRWAEKHGVRRTGHLFETPSGCIPGLLPYLERIGHGIQIPLRHPELLPEVAKRGQCLEVCPTTYLKTGNLSEISDLRPVFERCADTGVDIAICTDNAGLHNVRLPLEIENLLTEDVIDFEMLKRCQDSARKHAFAAIN